MAFVLTMYQIVAIFSRSFIIESIQVAPVYQGPNELPLRVDLELNLVELRTAMAQRKDAA